MPSLSSLSPQPPPTSDEVLLGQAVDAGQVSAVLPAVLLGVLPGVSPAEVAVAVAVELPPCVLAALGVCRCVQEDWDKGRGDNLKRQ